MKDLMEVVKESNQTTDSHDSSSSSTSSQGGENLPSQSSSSPKSLSSSRELRVKTTAFKKSQTSNNGTLGRSGRTLRAVPNPDPSPEDDAGSVHLTPSEIPSALRPHATRSSLTTAVRLNEEQCLTLDSEGGAHIVPASTVPSSQIADASESMDLSNDPRARRALRILRHTQSRDVPAAADATDLLDDSEQTDVRFSTSTAIRIT